MDVASAKIAISSQDESLWLSQLANYKHTVPVHSGSLLLPIFSRMTFANSSASSVPTRMIFRPSVSFTQAKPQRL